MCDRLNNKPLVSIIVPIYRVEKYLYKCVDSIIGQRYQNIEIILVDDGSDDECPQICDGYDKKDNRVCVIHKCNGGLVSARKAGLIIASGKYSIFVDGDDWIDELFIQELIEAAIENNSEVVVAGYTKVDDSSKYTICSNGIENGFYSHLMVLSDIAPYMINDKINGLFNIAPNVWNKLVKTELLRDNLSQIDDEITLGEDIVCSYPVIIRAKGVSICNNISGYYYRIRLTSMTGKNDENFIYHCERLFRCLDRVLGCYSFLDSQIKRYKLYIIFIDGIINIEKVAFSRLSLLNKLTGYNKQLTESDVLNSAIRDCRNCEIVDEKWIGLTSKALSQKKMLLALIYETVYRRIENSAEDEIV